MGQDEYLRLYLIELLRNSQIIFCKLDSEEPIYEYHNISGFIYNTKQLIKILKTKKQISEELLPIGMDKTDYKSAIKLIQKKLDYLLARTIRINKSSSLDDIANEIAKISEYPDYEDRGTLLYELKKQKTNEDIYNFIKENKTGN